MKQIKKIVNRLKFEVRKNNIIKNLKKYGNNTSKFSEEEVKKIDDLYNEYSIDIKNKNWHIYYKETNVYSEKYISELLFYLYIEPMLNDYSLKLAYSDKNLLPQLISEIKVPKIYLKNINGYFYDVDDKLISSLQLKEYIKNIKDGEYIIKPSLGTAGGKDVKILGIEKGVFSISNNKIKLEELLVDYKKNFLIQEKINHKNTNLSKIHPDSLNTLRVMSLRTKKGIEILSAVARFGNNGSIVDNYTVGGVAVGVDRKTGKLKKVANGRYSGKYEEHPYTNKRFENVTIENFSEIEKKLKKAHMNFKYFDLISWDIAIDSNKEIYLIEVNLGGQEISFHQIQNGPLFGEYTSEILLRVKEEYNSIKI